MDLYILRHGIAEEREETAGKPDSDRRLTSEGKRKMGRVAAGMKALGLKIDLLLTSPYLRAKETADIVADEFKLRKALAISPELVPHGNPRKLIDELNGRYSNRESVVLVGHEPYLSRFISLLISGDSGLVINLKKGGLCKLEVGELRYGRCAALHWLLAPKLMVK